MVKGIGRTERRVVAALLLTALVPLCAAMGLAATIIQRITRTAFQPEFGEQLERSLDLYAELVKAMKQGMRHEAAAIAERQALRAAAAAGDRAAVERELSTVLGEHPDLLSLEVRDGSDAVLAARTGARQLVAERERPFAVRTELGAEDGPLLVASFAADRRRIDEMEAAHEFVLAYKRLESEQRGLLLERPYLTAFALLFGSTVLLAIITGVLVVRPVTRRIQRLAAATLPVAKGDLGVRVDEHGRDELAALARAFNRMLEALGHSRARIEFLRRVSEWQAVARRLAHEIKNPLTPIQLAVEECHRRYDGGEEGYRKLLDATRDIVTEEVASLRRFVGEFAEFARLPRADLRHGDLGELVREQTPRRLRDDLAASEVTARVELTVDADDQEMPVALDRTMLYRVLSNLVTNAAQATAAVDRGSEAAHGGRVRVRVRREQEECVLDVDDDGPGIAVDQRQAVFDPYYTTKRDGTGLGLTIVKKIVIDHGGVIDVNDSPLGGARFRIRLPLLGTGASAAAQAQ
jgi:nitrogen fixation/metabolism regulation signal transduction histidine kinase